MFLAKLAEKQKEKVQDTFISKLKARNRKDAMTVEEKIKLEKSKIDKLPDTQFASN